MEKLPAEGFEPYTQLWTPSIVTRVYQFRQCQPEDII